MPLIVKPTEEDYETLGIERKSDVSSYLDNISDKLNKIQGKLLKHAGWSTVDDYFFMQLNLMADFNEHIIEGVVEQKKESQLIITGTKVEISKEEFFEFFDKKRINPSFLADRVRLFDLDIESELLKHIIVGYPEYQSLVNASRQRYLTIFPDQLRVFDSLRTSWSKPTYDDYDKLESLLSSYIELARIKLE